MKGLRPSERQHCDRCRWRISNGNPDEPVGTLTMGTHAQVNGNTASDGGGIYNFPDGVLVGGVAGGNVASNVPNDIVFAP